MSETTVYEITTGGYDDLSLGLFVSEEAAVSYLRNGKNISQLSGDWSEERHPSGDLIVRFRHVTPKRKLWRYDLEWFVTAHEVHE